MAITYSKGKDQPGKVTNPARGQLKRKMFFSLSPFAPENLVSRDGFGSTVPRQPAHLHTQAEYGIHLRDSSRVPRRRLFIYIKTAIRHRVSLEFIGSCNCVAMTFTAESSPAQGQLSSRQFQTGAVLTGHHGIINVLLATKQIYHIHRIGCQPGKQLYTVTSPARGLLNREKRTKI